MGWEELVHFAEEMESVVNLESLLTEDQLKEFLVKF